ncbi:hypothetical protein ACFVWR_18170 [Leifsonia sp. NPDC058292]|uniref:hypothetical protein n=1 Tax=Leifsonia sp. NPDC058292 TaxID=3346428 RepID=UPI0036DEB469
MDAQRNDDANHDAGDAAGASDAAGAEAALVSRLNLIEDQPLASRADAYSQVHDELRAELEGGDVQRHG